MSNHLTSIETRQRKTRVRDLFFAIAIVAAGVVSVHTVSTAVTAASPTHVAQR
jgi:hypothetical protein